MTEGWGGRVQQGVEHGRDRAATNLVGEFLLLVPVLYLCVENV